MGASTYEIKLMENYKNFNFKVFNGSQLECKNFKKKNF